jgi:hypothetical protein
LTLARLDQQRRQPGHHRLKLLLLLPARARQLRQAALL